MSLEFTLTLISTLLLIFLLFGRDISFSSRNRKTIKLKYFLPLFAYIVVYALFTFFVSEWVIRNLVLGGTWKIFVLGGPVGGRLVFLLFPILNIIFFVIYLITVLAVLTFWEEIVKYEESIPYLAPIVGFLSVVSFNVLRLGQDTAAGVIPPLACLMVSMVVTVTAGVIVMLIDLKKEFGRQVEAKKRQKAAEAASGKKRLLLIYPISKIVAGLSVRSYSAFPPLSMGILAALTPRDKFAVDLIDEQFEAFEYQDADLVAISAFTTYAPRAYEIAKIYRDKGIPVVMGGIHASMMTDEALQHVDCVVRGEAEEVWPNVLQDFLAGSLKQMYQGTMPELNNMVIPDRALFHHRYITASIQTSRGCPWNCRYCSVAAFNGRRYRQRPVEDVLDELETIPNRYVFFVDDNLIGYSAASKKRALELFKGMVQRKIHKRWVTQTTIDIGTEPELLKWAAKSGCLFLFIGLEFIDKKQLKEMDKHVAMEIDYTKALKNINRRGIGVIGAFIYGSDNETREKMIERANFIIHNRIDMMQQSKLTAFPGTQIFKQFKAEKRIVFTDYPRDWERYDFYELTHVPLSMSREECIRVFRQCVSRTYSLPVIMWKAMKTFFHTWHPETAMTAMRGNLSYRALSLYHMRKQRVQENLRPEGR